MTDQNFTTFVDCMLYDLKQEKTFEQTAAELAGAAAQRAAVDRTEKLEAAIHRFVDCGVELARFSIQEWPGETKLCIDGVPRFTWQAAGGQRVDSKRKRA